MADWADTKNARDRKREKESERGRESKHDISDSIVFSVSM